MESNRALLLVNMGGPANLESVGDYLRAIFNDPAILPLPRLVQSSLARFIAARRTPKVTARYRLIGGSSPLHHWTARLRDNVAAELTRREREIPVAFAFRYCSPTIESEFRRLHNMGVETVRLIPLFPHYTHTMTGSVLLAAQRAADEHRMKVTHIEDWGLDSAIIDLWFDYLSDALHEAGDSARVLFVAHGIPLPNVKRGDDYPDRVTATARNLGSRLNGVEWSLAFQSRVGPINWTGPYLEDELHRLCKSPEPIILMPLSFAADCLETLYDLDIVAATHAREAGVKSVVRVRAFNDDPRFARALVDLALEVRHAVLA